MGVQSGIAAREFLNLHVISLWVWVRSGSNEGGDGEEGENGGLEELHFDNGLGVIEMRLCCGVV
jgi:hypothetical protein